MFKRKHRIHFVQQDEVYEICFFLITGWSESGKAV